MPHVDQLKHKSTVRKTSAHRAVIKSEESPLHFKRGIIGSIQGFNYF